MSNLIRQSFVSVQQAASLRPSKNTDKPYRKSGYKKKHRSRRIRLKRLRERVYLSHFLAVNGIQPEHIICGEDDGKEPDFTLIIDNQYIGIELTTLPRLRDRMGNKHLLLKRWYWKVRAKLSVTLFAKMKRICRHVTYLRYRQTLHHYHSYDSHHQHFSHYQQHFHHKRHQKTQHHYLASLARQNTSLRSTHKHKHKNNADNQNTTDTDYSETVITFPKARHHLFSRLSGYVHTVFASVFSRSYQPIDQTDKPLSFISQADMDAVMSKKAHKAQGYHRRRPLDALWLLVHADGEQPDVEMSLPAESSVPICHDSEYDEVWVTVYPKRLSYKVAAAYQVTTVSVAA